MNTDFKVLLSRLIASDFDFVLIGGFAASSYGSSFVTQDLDICAVLSPANIEVLRKVLADLHPKHRLTAAKLSFLDVPQELDGIQNLYLRTDAGVLDVISAVTGVGDYETVRKSAVEIHLFNQKCKVIALEDLIRSKLAIKRPKDLEVAKELTVIHERLKS